MGLFRKTPLYRHALRLNMQEKKYRDKHFDAGTLGKPEYKTDISEIEERFAKKLFRSYRTNGIMADAVNGKRSIHDTVRLYTHGDDYELHGKCTYKASRRNRQLRRILGIRNPLDHSTFISDRKKINNELLRASWIDSLINKYGDRVLKMDAENPKVNFIENFFDAINVAAESIYSNPFNFYDERLQ